MTDKVREAKKLERRREFHGWAFRDYTPDQVQTIRAYLNLEIDEKPKF